MHKLSALVGLTLSLSASVAFAQGAPTLPQPLTYSIDAFPDTTNWPVTPVTKSSELQPALDGSQPGQIIELTAGVTFTGNFVLPLRCATDPQWTIIRTSNMSGLPPPGTRIDPAVHSAAMAKIVTDPNNNPVPALATRSYAAPNCVAQKFWIVGLEITPSTALPSSGFTGDLVELGDPGENDPAHMARNLYIDRSYIHGLASQGPSGRPSTHGIRMDAKMLAIFDSYISSFQDTVPSNKQGWAIASISGVGPMQITNNYIEGSGENTIFGGDDPATCQGPAGCTVISDITFTRNTVRKPLYWLPGPHGQGYVTGTPDWCIGDLFELKNASRVLVDSNDFQYSWRTECDGGLSYVAVQLTPRNQEGGDSAAIVEDVTFTNNYIAHAPGGFNIAAEDDLHPSQITKRMLISNNVLDDINSDTWHLPTSTPANGRIFMIITARHGVAGPDYVTIDHNTFINNDPNGNAYIYVDCGDQPCPPPQTVPHFTFTNNIVGEVTYGVMGGSANPDTTGHAGSTFNNYFDPTLTFTNNVIVGGVLSNYTNADGYVGNLSNNFFPATWDAVGFASFNSGNGGDYHLVNPPNGTNPFLTGGTGGSAVGAGGNGGCTAGAGFTSVDIGATGVPGCASLSGSTWTVKGSGADIWGTNDAFQFVYQQVTGDGVIIARVTHVDNTNTFAKAGVMIRESLNANAANALVDLRPSTDTEFLTRVSTGASTTWEGSTTITGAAWLKLERQGSTFTASVSSDGSSWTLVNTKTIDMSQTAYWGLAVVSHDNTVLNTSTFDSVSISTAGFNTQDISNVGVAGSATFDGSTWTVNGAGADVWDVADSFRYVYRALAGDGQLIARVATLTNTTNAFAKAGVMIRQTLDPGSPEAFGDFTPSDNFFEYLSRSTAGGTTTYNGGTGISVPNWVKVVRSGSNVTVYHSTDGTNWTSNGTVAFPTGPAYIGLAVCSHDTSTLATATFDNVQ
jgi:regulation of enolase protein 1 (concanavalin A-like superfamily)